MRFILQYNKYNKANMVEENAMLTNHRSSEKSQGWAPQCKNSHPPYSPVEFLIIKMSSSTGLGPFMQCANDFIIALEVASKQ